MHRPITCFKAYDARGRVPDEMDEDIAWRIGRAYAAFLNARRVVVGADMRHSSAALMQALARGLTEAGADVLDIGLCGTEEVYFATFNDADADGGIMITASHNPPDYNGMKFVREGSRPISADTGLKQIREMAESGEFAPAAATPGRIIPTDTTEAYTRHLLGYVDVDSLKPLKIVANPGNGVAGKAMDLLQPHLPFEIIKVHYEPDGDFPNGVPNPLIPENRAPTVEAIKASGADLALAWDGDFDRCFLFDEQGNFIEGYYIVGLLASAFLTQRPGQKIVHDPRLIWNTQDVAQTHGGIAVQTKAGHAFIKERMREEDAVYGGEMSAHHYFRDFAYCDSGMIPWLLISEIISRTGKPLSALIEERIAHYPASGEINRRVDDANAVMRTVREHYLSQALAEDTTDGLGLSFENWRFNLRKSNTEPLIRLNVESRQDVGLMQEKTDELLTLVGGVPG